MNILIVSATENEIQIEPSPNYSILISGVGILETTYNLTKRLCYNKYDLAINMGVAGSFNENIKIGDVVEVFEDHISEIGYESSNQFHTFKKFNIKTKFSVSGKTNLIKARGITVNKVHGNKSSIEKIKKRLNPDIESMEGAAFFKVCQDFNTPSMQIRAISNVVEERNKSNWNLPLAINNLNKEVKNIMNML